MDARLKHGASAEAGPSFRLGRGADRTSGTAVFIGPTRS